MENFIEKAQEQNLYISDAIEVQKEWIDYNGHLNAGYYNIIFDRAGDKGFEELGLGHKYAEETGFTIYTGEVHICYMREIHIDYPLCAVGQIVDFDEKRIHFFQHLCHKKEGWIAATQESIALHIDMEGPRVAPFPQNIMEKIENMATKHKNADTPQNVNKSIGIRKK